MEPTQFFIKANEYLCSHGYEWEIEYVRSIKPLNEQDSITFFREYVWVVLNAGMREQVARNIFNKFMEKMDLDKIRHIGKRSAIRSAIYEYEKWFEQLQKSENKIEFLDTLPWIGPITKYHLARNIGIDTVKPDRHLVRLAEGYGYKTPLELCQEIQKTIPEKLGVIDLILWRYCNLNAGDCKM